MPRSEPNQEQLWDLIQARKMKRPRIEEAPPASKAGESCPVADSVLVDVLYQALRGPEPQSGGTAAFSRLTLQSAIASDSLHAPLRQANRGFWQVSGKRSFILAAALLLITAMAIAYTVWAVRKPECGAASEAPVLTAVTGPLPGPAIKACKIDSGGTMRGVPIPTAMVTGSIPKQVK